MEYNSFGMTRIFTLKQLSIIIGVPLIIIQEFSDTAVKHYHPYIQKKEGKKSRPIANPSRALIGIQRRIVRRILNLVSLPDEIYGARPGRNLKQNALVHLRQPVLVTIDIRDCFPSVSHTRIFRLFREEFGYSEVVARTLTKLTTFRGSLPQGAATSAMLLNILLIPLCNRVRSLHQIQGMKLSFWVDDIAISGGNANLVCQSVVRELQKFGFKTRSKKVKVMFANRPQVLTGLLTNCNVAVPKKKLQQYISDATQGVTNSATNSGRSVFLGDINKKQQKRYIKRAS